MLSCESLLVRIEQAFPITEMPPIDKLLSRRGDDKYFSGLLMDIEFFRGRKVTLDLLRLVHREFSNLSAEAWCWIMPYYLRYCLTPDAEYSQMEVEFLIYALSPDSDYEGVVFEKLILLSKDQLACLLYFVMWCKGREHWCENFLSDLNQAEIFLNRLLEKKQ